MDPRIVQSLIAAGRMPNLAKLAARGSIRSMATSTPPHTPVAFSSIIAGADPGVHNIFDFIHRDPNPPGDTSAIRPFFSTADATPPENQWAIPLGKWHLPLTGGSTRLLRRGQAFWDALVAAGVDTRVYYLPSNFPPQQPEGPGDFYCMSGMGTPDLLGSYGEFTLFTPDAPARGRTVDGGRFQRISMLKHYARAELIGPTNFLRGSTTGEDAPPMKAPLEIARDPTAPVAKIRLAGQPVLLNEGEWSDWLPVTFHTGIPAAGMLKVAGAPTSIQGMVRLFMKQVHPKFELYVSPINIDPLAPVNPISVPPRHASDLARRHGRFYTLGIPEDTKALSHRALDEEQFLAQSDLAMQERVGQYRQALKDHQQGCLFFYFGATDLLQHMFWRDRDPEHPGHQPEEAERFGGVVEDVYQQMDELVGDALAAAGPNDAVIVFSDHGFTSFRRGFHLNSWLVEQGFIKLRDPSRQGQDQMFANVDWSRTAAYGLGMNGLYLNASGREKYGSVPASERRSRLFEIRDKLMEARDDNGAQMIRNIYLVDEIYPGADPTVAPDLIIGYEDGYRASWDTVLGTMPRGIVSDNLDRWSGTHLISADRVPGVLVASHPVNVDQPDIRDIAPTILAHFGVARPAQMTGRSLFSQLSPLPRT